VNLIAPSLQRVAASFLMAGVLQVAILTADAASFFPRADRVHQEALLVDGHNDITSVMLDSGFDLGDRGDHADGIVYDFKNPQAPRAGQKFRTQTDLRRMKQGGVDAQFFSIYVNARSLNRKPSEGGGPARRALDMIDSLARQVAKHSDEMEMARSVADIRRIVRRDKIAALMGLEGGYAIEDSLAVLRTFHQLGIRYMTLTHTDSTDWADSSGDFNNPDVRHHDGLTDFGREVVREMNRLGMMVDISHVADATFWDVLETTRSPVIASHSSCRALANHPRNLTDEMLRALGTNGGIIMLNFADEFVDQRVVDFKKQMREFESAAQKKYPEDPEKARAECQAYYSTNYPRPPVSLLVNHIEHVVKVAGIDHVGLGSDFDGEIRPPIGLEDVACFPRITASLAQRGYSDGDIKKVLGENLLRVMAAVEAVGEARVERLE